MQNTRTTRTRKTILSIVAAGITAAAITFPVLTGQAEAAPVAPITETTAPQQLDTPEYNAEEQQIIDWAFGLYAEAGMDLPTVVIFFHDTSDGCQGYKGLQTLHSDGTSVLDICDNHEREMLRIAWRKKTIMHELAHAWADGNLTDADKAAFTAQRGLDEWRGDADWHLRGTEHAAEVVAWGLMDTKVRVDTRIPNSTCTELAESFEFLTGAEATNGLENSCRS